MDRGHARGGSYTLVIDDDVDGVIVRALPGKIVVRIELESTEARPFMHDAQCKSEWRAPNSHVGVPARLCLPDEPLRAHLQWVPVMATMVAKSHFPDGRRASFTITDHADQTSLPTLRALAHGRSDAPPEGPPTMGLIGHHLAITKALFAHGSDRPQLEDPAVVALADELNRAGSEIVPHSATPKRDDRPVTVAALDIFERWHARTWIDHQPETNCEAFGDEGFHSSGRFGIADLLAAHGYDYVWAEVDLDPGPLNLCAPIVWDSAHRRSGPLAASISADRPALWMFRSQWAFLEAKHFYALYSPAAIDRLGARARASISHTPISRPITRTAPSFGMKNLLVPADPHELAGGTGPVMLAPEFERLLAALEARQERGTLWVTTLAALADRHAAVMAAARLTLGAPIGAFSSPRRGRSRAPPLIIAKPNARACSSTARTPAGARQDLGRDGDLVCVTNFVGRERDDDRLEARASGRRRRSTVARRHPVLAKIFARCAPAARRAARR